MLLLSRLSHIRTTA